MNMKSECTEPRVQVPISFLLEVKSLLRLVHNQYWEEGEIRYDTQGKAKTLERRLDRHLKLAQLEIPFNHRPSDSEGNPSGPEAFHG